jgi:hypothetical protein
MMSETRLAAQNEKRSGAGWESGGGAWNPSSETLLKCAYSGSRCNFALNSSGERAERTPEVGWRIVGDGVIMMGIQEDSTVVLVTKEEINRSPLSPVPTMLWMGEHVVCTSLVSPAILTSPSPRSPAIHHPNYLS